MCPVLLAVLVDAFHWLAFLRGVGLGPFDELMFVTWARSPLYVVGGAFTIEVGWVVHVQCLGDKSGELRRGRFCWMHHERQRAVSRPSN